MAASTPALRAPDQDAAPERDRQLAASRAANTLSTVCHETATALLPGFISGTIGAAPVVLGAIEAAGEGVGGSARYVGGELSAHPVRRRRISVLGYVGAALCSAVTGAASAAWQVGILRAGAQGARGLRSPMRYAAVPGRVPADRLGREFGIERAAEHAGAALGPLLAFGLLLVVGIRTAIALAIVPGALAVVIALRAMGPATAPPTRVGLRAREVLRGPLGRVLLGIGLFELANIAVTLLVLRATKLLQTDAPALGAIEVAVLLYVVYRVVAAGTGLPAGRLVDRLGAAFVMAGAVLLLLGAYAGFAAAEASVVQLAACFVVAGAATAAIECAEHAAVGKLAAPEDRWSAFGMLSALQAGGRLFAAITAGVLWTLVAPAAGLLFAAPLMLASAVVLARLAAR